jgi:hypothetical protein
VFDPGHYRVALAVNSRAELPPGPPANTRDSERGPWSVSSEWGAGQWASLFCLENKHWRIIGLDTGYTRPAPSARGRSA